MDKEGQKFFARLTDKDWEEAMGVHVTDLGKDAVLRILDTPEPQEWESMWEGIVWTSIHNAEEWYGRERLIQYIKAFKPTAKKKTIKQKTAKKAAKKK